MIHVAKSPNLDFLFNHGHIAPPPLPLLVDSAGNFCWELNSYLTKFGGGANSYGARPSYKTVFSHAETINVFQIFLEHKGKTLLETDDEILYDFVTYLQDANRANSTTIKRTVRRVLSLLEHTQSENSFHHLMTCDPSANDYQINAIEHHYRRSRQKSLRYLSHPCIEELQETPTQPISFIRNVELNAWHEAIFEYTSNQFIIDRWYVFSSLLEFTGARLEEAINIPASSIIRAYEDNDLVKGIPVLKGKYKGFFREVLIPRSELQEIYKFIITTREKHPISKVHDRILVNETTGQPLARKTFNSYYRTVTKSSKHAVLLKGVSHHNFRHRYFTILVARNINKLSKISRANILDVALSIARKDSFHASRETLSTYVHLTQDPEILSILKSYENEVGNAESKLAAIAEIAGSLGKEMTPEAALAAIIKIMEV
jgi:site-specific recombinase XerD